MHRRRAIGAIGASLACGLGFGRAGAATSDSAAAWLGYDARLRGLLASPPGEGFQGGVETAILGETNRFRQAEGLAGLQPHTGLERAARAAAADMAGRHFFDHRSPEGRDPSDRVGLLARELCGASGENIAFQEGGRAPPTARSFFEQWRDSPGHRENMLRPSFTHAGHGVIRVGARTYAAAAFASEQLTLGAEPPLRLASGRSFADALAMTDPGFDRFQISAPDGSQASPVMRLGERGELPSGVWRLRPYLPAGRNRYLVLWGPIFIGG